MAVNPERWRYIERIYHLAMARPAHERELLLDDECRGDESLRLEVASLLSRAASAEHFLNEPVFALEPPRRGTVYSSTSLIPWASRSVDHGSYTSLPMHSPGAAPPPHSRPSVSRSTHWTPTQTRYPNTKPFERRRVLAAR